MFTDNKFGLPESLIKAVQEATKSHTVPKTEKEKKLAALAEPKDKITHKDVMVGRGVVAKEETELEEGQYVPSDVHINPAEKFAKEKEKAHNSAVEKAKQIAKMRLNKEETDKETKQEMDKQVRMDKEYSSKLKRMKDAAKVMANKEAQKDVSEEKDTPGNSNEHQCALHVKHAKLGEGRCLTTQHADPAEDGSIEWYDVMFEHGIERVMTTDIEILVSESHMHAKRKGKM